MLTSGILVAVFSLSSSTIAAPALTPEQAARAYLRQTFTERRYPLPDLPTIYRDAPLYPIPEPVLTRILPDTLYYSTTLEGTWEYPEVETLVSVRRSNRGYDVRAVLSPRFADVGYEAFLSQFIGVRIEERAQRAAFTIGIAELFATVTYDGCVLRSNSCSTSCTAKLWGGEAFVLDNVVVRFSPNGTVRSVKISIPARE